ncbi:MAG: protein-glutamate O-methyltransferase CheR [Alphaproteobacteria bacterium]|nr:protein-glutamate O-methyltransferase CheR [Alphaproteobacteria bacterium]
MRPDEFQFLADMLKKRSGLTLTEDKLYLIESRLLPIARAQGVPDISALCNVLRTRSTEALLVEITEAMTTNESSFFRDIKPYEQLRNIIFPMQMEKLGMTKSMRIWSAACSTGQEPYSISMCIQEDAAKLPGWRFDIVATDLAKKVVDKAKEGVYSQFEAQRGLPIQMLVKYFTARPDTSWQLKDNIRNSVQFKTNNLLESYDHLGKFDIIFCRNVLIYFDDPIKAAVTDKMARALNKTGVLMIGATESLVDPKGLFTPIPEIRGGYVLK